MGFDSNSRRRVYARCDVDVDVDVDAMRPPSIGSVLYRLSSTRVLLRCALFASVHLAYALPPMILCAGLPCTSVGLAKVWPHAGQTHGVWVRSSVMRSR